MTQRLNNNESSSKVRKLYSGMFPQHSCRSSWNIPPSPSCAQRDAGHLDLKTRLTIQGIHTIHTILTIHTVKRVLSSRCRGWVGASEVRLNAPKKSMASEKSPPHCQNVSLLFKKKLSVPHGNSQKPGFLTVWLWGAALSPSSLPACLALSPLYNTLPLYLTVCLPGRWTDTLLTQGFN